MQDRLIEIMVLPTPVDFEVIRCHADVGESVVQEHSCGRLIMQKGARFNSV